jgi:hypothetical protein
MNSMGRGLFAVAVVIDIAVGALQGNGVVGERVTLRYLSWGLRLTGRRRRNGIGLVEVVN